MGVPPIVPRRRHQDGSIDILCSSCGKVISQAGYKGFSTAICYECATGNPQPLTMQQQIEIRLDNEVESLYNMEQMRDDVGFTSALIRANGFARAIVQKVKQILKPNSSIAVAKKKKRKPLFERGDAENVREDISD